MKTFAAVLLLSLAVTTAAAQTSKSNDDMKDCPLHAQHMKEASSPAQHAHGADSSDLEAMNRRGNEGMGFDQAKTIHHFLIANDGGSINVSAKSTDDGDSITAIRQHFQHIAQAFAAGDFSIPMFVHDQPPPGVAQMQKLGMKHEGSLRKQIKKWGEYIDVELYGILVDEWPHELP